MRPKLSGGGKKKHIAMLSVPINLPKNFQVSHPFIQKTMLPINLPPSAKREFFLAWSGKLGSVMYLPATSCSY